MAGTLPLLHFRPHYIFIISAINECHHLAALAPAKQNSAFHTFTEENIAGLRDEFFPRPAVALRIHMAVLDGYSHPPLRAELIDSDIAWESIYVRLPRRRIFVIAQHRP